MLDFSNIALLYSSTVDNLRKPFVRIRYIFGTYYWKIRIKTAIFIV